MNLNEIQKKLKAPKGQFNDFGKYKYRNCEDILEAVKSLLGDSLLTLSDEIVEVGGRVYVKATASFWNEKEQWSVTAYAREAEQKKGMDASQITGAASSYARKYALNGLLLIDDTKDADSDKQPDKQPDKIDSMPEDVRQIFINRGYKDRGAVNKLCAKFNYNWDTIRMQLGD